MTFSPPKEEPDPGMEWRPVSELIDKRGRFGRCTIHGYDFLTPPGGGVPGVHGHPAHRGARAGEGLAPGEPLTSERHYARPESDGSGEPGEGNHPHHTPAGTDNEALSGETPHAETRPTPTPRPTSPAYLRHARSPVVHVLPPGRSAYLCGLPRDPEHVVVASVTTAFDWSQLPKMRMEAFGPMAWLRWCSACERANGAQRR